MATASPEIIPQTNLFGGGGVMSPPETTNNNVSSPSKKTTTTTNNDTAKSQWFEEDDELLLSTLLIGDNAAEQERYATDNLDQRLSQMHLRFQQDLSRATSTTSDRWWNILTDMAISSGFQCASVPNTAAGGGGVLSSGSGGTLPKSFHTTEGQQHLQAVMDLLGISRERAVQLTLATLRSFASLNSSSSSEDK